MVLSYETKEYPNGSKYFQISIGKEVIGNATWEGEGLLVHGRRKPVDTLKEAAKQILDSKMNKCMKEHARLHRLLQNIL